VLRWHEWLPQVCLLPPGFHITTLAYRHFVEENELQEQILTAIPQFLPLPLPIIQLCLEEVSQQIAQLFAQSGDPDGYSRGGFLPGICGAWRQAICPLQCVPPQLLKTCRTSRLQVSRRHTQLSGEAMVWKQSNAAGLPCGQCGQ